jgi:hypothetical protein
MQISSVFAFASCLKLNQNGFESLVRFKEQVSGCWLLVAGRLLPVHGFWWPVSIDNRWSMTRIYGPIRLSSDIEQPASNIK